MGWISFKKHEMDMVSFQLKETEQLEDSYSSQRNLNNGILFSCSIEGIYTTEISFSFSITGTKENNYILVYNFINRRYKKNGEIDKTRNGVWEVMCTLNF